MTEVGWGRMPSSVADLHLLRIIIFNLQIYEINTFNYLIYYYNNCNYF